jgi:probable phosphoglycerate mutase
LVLLRHGRTAYNHERRIQGQLDVPLDETGVAQAAAVAPAMAALSPAVDWCSDLLRTRQTAEPVLAACGRDATYDARLREYHLGERQGMTHDEYAAAAPEEFARFHQGDFEVVPGGESGEDVRTRTVGALTELLDAVGPGETALAISHGAAIRVATVGLLGWPAEQVHALRGLDNCGWVELLEQPERGRLRLLAYNRTA